MFLPKVRISTLSSAISRSDLAGFEEESRFEFFRAGLKAGARNGKTGMDEQREKGNRSRNRNKRQI